MPNAKFNIKNLFNVKSEEFALTTTLLSGLGMFVAAISEKKELVDPAALVLMLSFIRYFYLRYKDHNNSESKDRTEIITAEDLKDSGVWFDSKKFQDDLEL